MRRNPLILAAGVMLGLGTCVAAAGVVWKDAVTDALEAADLMRAVNAGGALVVAPVKSAEAYKALEANLGKTGLPQCAKNNHKEAQGAEWMFRFGGHARGWRMPEWMPRHRGDIFAEARVGKGLIVLSTVDVKREYPDFEAKLDSELDLQNVGLRLRGFSFESWNPGGGRRELPFGYGCVDVNLNNTSATNAAVEIELVVECAAGRHFYEGYGGRKDPGDFRARIQGIFDQCGKCTATMSLKELKSGKTFNLKEWRLDRPEYFVLEGPYYRSMVSTARRQSDVGFLLRFNGYQEDCLGRKAEVTLFDKDGRTELASKTVEFQRAPEVEFTLPLAKDAKPGSYRAVAKWSGIAAETSVKVVPVREGQVFIDQDGVLLKDGKPWFPMGFYHVYNTNDIERIAAMGVDFVQFWASSCSPENIAALKKHDIRIAIEGSGWGQIISTWTGVPKDVYPFETNTAERAKAEKILAEKNLLAMWYTADEPGFDVIPGVKRLRDYWAKIDPEDHPSYVVGTGDPRLAAGGDVFGLDIYARYYGSKRPLTLVSDAMYRAHAFNRRGQCVIAVPQAFGSKEVHGEEPKDVLCMSYLALSRGVKGLLYYTWYDNPREGAYHWPETRKVVAQVIKEVRECQDSLHAPGARELVSSDRRVLARLCGDGGNGRVLLAVNGTEKDSVATLSLPELVGKSIEPLFGSPAATVGKDGLLKLSLSAEHRAVWRVR